MEWPLWVPVEGSLDSEGFSAVKAPVAGKVEVERFKDFSLLRLTAVGVGLVLLLLGAGGTV